MNVFAIFKKLLPDAPLEIGNVIAISNGVAIVELPDGGTISARGNADVGDRVFVRDGVIEGPAPALFVELIEV